jgi:hypothetical protein
VGLEPVGELRWHQGRPCDSGACVEVAEAGEEVLLRSTISPGALLALSRSEWHEFLAGAKEGLFDQL